MSLAGLPLLPGLLFLLLSEPPIPPSPPVMFRGDPAHTGATVERLPMIQAAAEYGLLRR